MLMNRSSKIRSSVNIPWTPSQQCVHYKIPNKRWDYFGTYLWQIWAISCFSTLQVLILIVSLIATNYLQYANDFNSTLCCCNYLAILMFCQVFLHPSQIPSIVLDLAIGRTQHVLREWRRSFQECMYKVQSIQTIHQGLDGDKDSIHWTCSSATRHWNPGTLWKEWI